MKKRHTITQKRVWLSRHKKSTVLFFVGWVVGLILNPSSIYGIVDLFRTFPKHVLSIGSILFLITIVVTVPWLILLKDKLKVCQKNLKQFAPSGFNADTQEENSRIRNEVLKEDEFKHWQ